MDRSLVRRRAGRVFLGAVGGVTVVALAIVAAMALPKLSVMASGPPPAATAEEVDVALRLAGITPDALAAAGANEAAAALILASATTAITDDIEAYRNALAAWNSAKAQLQPLERLAASGLATSAQLADLASARTTLQTTSGTLNTWLVGIQDAASLAASVPVAANLATLFAVDCNVPLAPAYDLGELSFEDRVTLHRLLRAEAAAESGGEDLPSGMQDTLTTFQSNTAIASALQDWQLNIAGVTTAWNDAINAI